MFPDKQKTIEPCIFSNPYINRYEQAMMLLAEQHGGRNGVILAHKSDLMNGKLINDLIADFETLSNELKCFHSILLHYDANLKYFSGEVVKIIITCAQKILLMLRKIICPG